MLAVWHHPQPAVYGLGLPTRPTAVCSFKIPNTSLPAASTKNLNHSKSAKVGLRVDGYDPTNPLGFDKRFVLYFLTEHQCLPPCPDSCSNFANTSGSRTSTHRPWISKPAILCFAASMAITASVNSYSPRGDFSSFAVNSNTDGRKT